MTDGDAIQWWRESFIGIEVWQYLGLFVLAVIAVALRLLIGRAAVVLIQRRTSPGRAEFLQRELRLLQRPLLGVAVAVTLLVGFPVLDFEPDVENVVLTFSTFLAVAAAVFFGLRLVDVAADYWARIAEETDSKLDDQLVPLARTAGKLFVTAIGLIFVLQNLSVNITSLIAGLGIGGVAVALAAQDTLKNLLGGATILADKPFHVGDRACRRGGGCAWGTRIRPRAARPAAGCRG